MHYDDQGRSSGNEDRQTDTLGPSRGHSELSVSIEADSGGQAGSPRYALKSARESAMFNEIRFCSTEAIAMAKAPASKPPARGAKSSAVGPPNGSAKRTKVVQREVRGNQLVISKARFEAVMEAAKRSGLLSEKSGRIGGRVSRALVTQAKRQTGIKTDTDLIEFALATVALEDNFAETFKESRGKVDPVLKLGF
jgi:hypothetical protein